MAKEFVEQKVGASSIREARKQQKQLSYFTQSQLQKDITQEYINKWAERNFLGNDDFLNWVKTIFKTDNFLSFFKYFRNPLASARLVNDRVKPQLQRVFHSEDSHFKYVISGQEVKTPEELNVNDFNEWMFNAILFRHNDVLVTDLRDINTPFRQLISIENIVAIESERNVISRLAYTATIQIIEDDIPKVIDGFLFLDAHNYIFYDKDLIARLVVPHDLGECPADYISREAFSDDDIIRKSMFSFIREEFEEYTFLKTLQRMVDANGTVPIITKLQDRDRTDHSTTKGSSDKQPPMALNVEGQEPEFIRQVAGKKSPIQAGTIIEIPIIKKGDGSIDIDVVKNYLTFFFTPTEALKFLGERIQEVENKIIVALLGDLKDQTGERKNEIQVKSGFISAEDKLRSISAELTRIRQRSDFKFLALQHGRDNVMNEAFYGSDFFLQTEQDLFNLFEKSPNPIERRSILLKVARNRNRFNKDQSAREVILNTLLPYASDKDFDKAVDRNAIDNVTFQYQTRFDYWIRLFEAQHGDILVFWEALGDTPDSQKLIAINGLITNIIKAIVPEPVVIDEQ